MQKMTITLTEKRYYEWHEDDKSVTLRNHSASMGGGSEVLVVVTKSDPCAQEITKESETNTSVRRLTPLECERLQGYPDGWTDIGEWTDDKGKTRQTTDGARYKALGNSIALPQWWWLVNKMQEHLHLGATLGSLFDGIGGFPLVWEECYGEHTARWASEIEPFPIAVTKVRFPEDMRDIRR